MPTESIKTKKSSTTNTCLHSSTFVSFLPLHSRMLRYLLVFFLLGLGTRVESHEESGHWSCESESEIRVETEFKPGVITLDGHADDWKDIDGSYFPLLPALDPDAENEFKGGKMSVKSVHDGRDIFFLLQVDGDYAYSKGESNKCPSVALMFQIGDSASYHDMGGCKEHSTSCTDKTCKGHEVDIMHFSIGSAIPGRLYGGNPLDNRDGNGGDRFGHLVDLYAWNPHCRYLDGIGPPGSANDSSAQNDWKGAWWHSSFTVHSGFVEDESPYADNGKKGTYFFEFSRSLRTMDHLQQDVQFNIGGSSKMSVAFWYPVDGQPWHGSGHYSVYCDWVPIDISVGKSLNGKSVDAASNSSWNVASAFSVILSVAALCVSVFVSYRVFSPKSVSFTPIENNNL
ncbi:hypothetical protein AAZX31_02G010800 [Glycine max]|uniref:Cytochrome c-552/DMSO reductase-like haem-binding domain-containing protein n=2 Tax=Glycine subgen. Soja TaxID=1462606 RepID=I1JBE8_SOYBN|nr:uncharacterized protein LOC100786799 [Glycine max]XP_028192681.1 uncharacterized protein LOC114378305 [Glycine soja]KAG5078809.1 hypothetical protein JHK86_002874 [Glycine max]KAH1058212.1 hypothetical protein GYH30_002663 [Glycine max]KAH1259821.1 hypothetical protein GmHk_02G003107 [Glycine max]KRH69199.1 hypothetical protein GLYMA_02G011100v4 [Glycine max]RZC22871.1 hypothetical protein D0Y65_002639 [Glycine soja]|eukprot:XP_014619678.1 uncharacterized protein LOC100786799 [Glycine max]